MPEEIKYPGFYCEEVSMFSCFTIRENYEFSVGQNTKLCRHCSDKIGTTSRMSSTRTYTTYTATCPRVMMSEGFEEQTVFVCLDCVEEAIQKNKSALVNTREVPDV